MNPAQLAGLALIAFCATEFFTREGQAAKSFTRTAADRGTTPLLIWIGASAAEGQLWLLVLISAVLLGVDAWRIAVEETMLVKELGPDYSAYQQHSWRLIPLLF